MPGTRSIGAPPSVRRHAFALACTTTDAVVLALLYAGAPAGAAWVAMVAVAALALWHTITQHRHRAALTQAYTDPVTGLAMRRLVEQRLAAADTATALSVALVDIDAMHEVNNHHGHAFGDAYLRAVADRLSAAAQPPDLLARLGGDEFVLITTRTAEALGQALAQVVAPPLQVNGYHLPMRLSIGISHSPAGQAAGAARHLLACADLAMYAAKHAGGGITHYRPERHGSPLPHGARAPQRRRDRRCPGR